MQIRLDYDDNILDTIEKINKALESRGLRLVDDEKEHDGFMLLSLEEVPKKS